MPAPLLDLSALDLSRPLFTKDDVYGVLRHRGTFALVDGILHMADDPPVTVGYVDVRKDSWWAPDHIPGRPLFPGVLMIEAATQIGCFDFFRRNSEIGVSFVGFAGVEKARFRAPVEPDCRLLLAAQGLRTRGRAGRIFFHYAVQGFVEDKLVFDTEVSGMQM
jgi:3-hydroxyacyl-[acyl-carrier-protein] dehydratase